MGAIQACKADEVGILLRGEAGSRAFLIEQLFKYDNGIDRDNAYPRENVEDGDEYGHPGGASEVGIGQRPPHGYTLLSILTAFSLIQDLLVLLKLL